MRRSWKFSTPVESSGCAGGARGISAPGPQAHGGSSVRGASATPRRRNALRGVLFVRSARA
eukprot:8867347-Lingulodinium_polyedra.AAC.1